MSRLWQVCLLLEGSHREVSSVFLGSQPLYSGFGCSCALFPNTAAFCDQSPACPHHLLCCSSDPGGCGSWPLGISYLYTPHARPDPDEDSMCFSPEPPRIPVCRITQENQKCAVIFWLHFLFMNSDVLFSFVEMREEQNYNNWSNFWWLKNNQQTIYNSPRVMYEPKCYLVMLVSQKCYIIMLLFYLSLVLEQLNLLNIFPSIYSQNVHDAIPAPGHLTFL